jgi:hypothetical protein
MLGCESGIVCASSSPQRKGMDVSEVGSTEAGKPEAPVRRYLVVANQTLGGP